MTIRVGTVSDNGVGDYATSWTTVLITDLEMWISLVPGSPAAYIGSGYLTGPDEGFLLTEAMGVIHFSTITPGDRIYVKSSVSDPDNENEAFVQFIFRSAVAQSTQSPPN